jgi:hypothetical protein
MSTDDRTRDQLTDVLLDHGVNGVGEVAGAIMEKFTLIVKADLVPMNAPLDWAAIEAAYANTDLPWIDAGYTTEARFMVATPLGHLESDNPYDRGGKPVARLETTRYEGELYGSFPNLGHVSVDTLGNLITTVEPWTKQGQWITIND